MFNSRISESKIWNIHWIYKGRITIDGVYQTFLCTLSKFCVNISPIQMRQNCGYGTSKSMFRKTLPHLKLLLDRLTKDVWVTWHCWLLLSNQIDIPQHLTFWLMPGLISSGKLTVVDSIMTLNHQRVFICCDIFISLCLLCHPVMLVSAVHLVMLHYTRDIVIEKQNVMIWLQFSNTVFCSG